jgi:arginase
MKNQMQQVIKLIGYASGVAANNIDCSLGPWYMYSHQDIFNELGFEVEWQTILKATSKDSQLEAMPAVVDIVTKLAKTVLPVAKAQEQFCVIGGDHSSAMGTWSAVAHANRARGDIGLIWIDAHMDCHTTSTSETKNIHGMALAHLLGQGNHDLTSIMDANPAVKPENVCLIGVRSFESGEKEIIERLGVKVFGMDEVKQQGLTKVFEKASLLVSKSTCGVGISLDLDGIDPIDAPGVGCAVPDGINGSELVKALKPLASSIDLLGLEIVEYNPVLDIQGKTAKLAMELFNAVYG